jgi:hypothetical protein
MAYIAFCGDAIGASCLSISMLQLALMPAMKAYRVWGSGGGFATFIGRVRSSTYNGFYIPDVDGGGRALPSNLEHKTVIFEVDSGISFGTAHPIQLTIKSLRGRQSTLYQWEGRVPLWTTAVGGYKIQGTANEIPETDDFSVFDELMTGDPQDSAKLRQAFERAAARHR